MIRWTWVPVLALSCMAAQADLYRWTDKDGKVHYSDQLPPADIKQVETRKAQGGKPTEAPLPYSLQQAVKNFPLTLYTSPCGDACTQAKALLAKRGAPYTEKDATDAEIQVELRKITGGAVEVPVLKIGSDALRGYEEGRWNNALDAAGYPRTALIAPKPVAKAPKPAQSPKKDAPAQGAAPAPAPEASR